jgi:hypothetical protein
MLSFWSWCSELQRSYAALRTKVPAGEGALSSLSPGCVTAWQSHSWNALAARVCTLHQQHTVIHTHYTHLLYDELYVYPQELVYPPYMPRARWGAIAHGPIVISSATLTLRIITSPAPLATWRHSRAHRLQSFPKTVFSFIFTAESLSHRSRNVAWQEGQRQGQGRLSEEHTAARTFQTPLIPVMASP